MQAKWSKAWGGFCDDKLHWRCMHAFPQRGYEEWMPAIYRTRKEAKKYYEDVRRVFYYVEVKESRT